MEFKDYEIGTIILEDGRSLWKVSAMESGHSMEFTNLYGVTNSHGDNAMVVFGPSINDTDVTSKLLKVLFGVGNV